MIRKRALATLLLAMIGVSQIAHPQSGQSDSEPARIISPGRGFQPAHSYAIADIESIDTATGSLSLHIPIAQLPQGAAGFTAGLTLVYSNKYWETEPQPGGVTTYALRKAETGGWRLAMAPELRLEIVADRTVPLDDPCSPSGYNDLYQLRLQNPDGSQHLFLLSSPGLQSPLPLAACEAGTNRYHDLANWTQKTIWYTADGSFLRLEIDAPPGRNYQEWPDSTSWTLYRQDGSTVSHDSNGTIRLKDRNGNQILITRSWIGSDYYETMTDDFGRSIRLDHLQTSTGYVDEVRQTGHDGNEGDPLLWRITYESLNFSPFPDQYHCANAASITDLDFDSFPFMATRLELPNGLSYQFAYDSATESNYGELRRVSLPTGATVLYGYRLDKISGVRWYYDILSNTIASKTLAHDGTSDTWSYLYEPRFGAFYSGAWTAPDGGVTAYEFSTLTYRYGLLPGAGTVTSIVNPDGSGTKRKWGYNRPYGAPLSLNLPNPFVKEEWSVTANSSHTPVAMSVQIFSVDKNGNTTSREDRDWEPYSAVLPLLPSANVRRKIVTRYLHGAHEWEYTGEDTSAYSYGGQPSVFRNLVSSTEIRDNNDLMRSRTDFNYEINPSGSVENLKAESRWDSTNNGWLVRQYTYTQRGNLSSETDPKGNTTTYDYGLVAGCPGNTQYADLYRTGKHQGYLDWSYTTNCYSGLLSSTTDPNSLVSSFNYDKYGRPRTIVDGSYRKIVHTYNDQARWIVTQSDLESYGDLKKVSAFHFDQLGRIRLTRELESSVADPSAAADESLGIKIETRYVWNSAGNQTWLSNPYRNGEPNAPTRGWSVKKYDTVGRPCVEEWFAGGGTPVVASGCTPSSAATGTTTYSYDATVDWRSERAVDPAGKASDRYFDVFGRLIAVVEDPSTAKYVTYYGYDVLDDLTSVRQAGTCNSADPIASPCGGGQTRSFTYNSLKQLVTATNPELSGGVTTYRYDANGNLTTKLSPGPMTTTYGYDFLNRLENRAYSDGTPAVTYCYDGRTWDSGACTGGAVSPSKLHLTEVGSAVSKTSYGYDPLGRVSASTQTTAGVSYSFSYSHNLADKMKKESYPSGRVITAEYDEFGRMKNLRGQNAGATTGYIADNSIQYAAHGGVTSLVMGNGILETRSYNDRLQLTVIQVGALLTLLNCYQAGDAADCRLLANVTGNNGNVQGQKITRGSRTWLVTHTYDGLNRVLSSAEMYNSSQTWSQGYGYDQYGNRWVSSGLQLNAQTPLSSGAFDRETNRLRELNYDLRGNLAQYGAHVLQYDGDDRLVKSTGAPSAGYEYDGEGRRVRSYSCSSSPSCTPQSAGVVTTVYVYDAFGHLTAEYGSQPPQGSGTSYVSQDYLGSTRLQTNSAAQQTECYDYLPFGEELPATVGDRSGLTCFAPTATRIKFTGKPRDPETGLDYSGARYISSAQGRFTSTDPLNIPNLTRVSPGNFLSVISDPQNWNGYAYAHNNPLGKLDPDGYLTIIVPGSFNSHEQWEDLKGRFRFRESVEKKFGERAVVLANNRMWDSAHARTAAAKLMVEKVNHHSFAPGEKLNIVTHSHGGNVVFEATTLGLNHKIDTLVTLGAPIRPDYIPSTSIIGQHINAYSRNDWIQPLGGMRISSPGSVVPMLLPAWREMPGAENIDATSTARGHSELWQDLRTWKEKVEPQIRK